MTSPILESLAVAIVTSGARTEREIILHLLAGGFRASDIDRHLDAAIAVARIATGGRAGPQEAKQHVVQDLPRPAPGRAGAAT